MQIERVIAKGQLYGCLFMQDNLAASQTDAALTIAEVASAAGNAVASRTMPWTGEVIAMSVTTSAAATAGTLTVSASIGGTKKTASSVAVTTETGKYLRLPRGTLKFNAGDSIGSVITTDGSWDATTADLAVTVWVLLELEGI